MGVVRVEQKKKKDKVPAWGRSKHPDCLDSEESNSIVPGPTNWVSRSRNA